MAIRVAPLCFVLSVLVAAASSAAADDAALFGKQIQTPEKLRPELQAAVADLKAALQQITGEEFSASPDSKGTGIVLARDDNEATPAEAKKLLPAGFEACVLWPAEQKLWIVGRSDLGLAHGIYFYLEQLGARYYFPSERWTIMPRRDDIRLKKAFAASPAFRSRVFAGSGGFGGNLPVDPKRQMQARWTDWQRRNRFGGEFKVSGHSGEGFNVKYKKELEAHPEWRAMINGERVPLSAISKFSPANQEVVDLFIKDRVADYRQRQLRDPQDPGAWAVSVEPSDGGGHCTSPESLALGTVSDRVFHVANQVARAVKKEFPDGRVSLFAYNEHAPPPSIEIEPNVYVQVIPYAFQRTGLTPDQLLDAWSKKVPRMGIYDYWSIPDWSHDLPTFDPLVFGPTRMRGWQRRGVDSFLCESTHGSGAVGPAWYIGSRVSWDPKTDVDALFTEFTRDCFGAGAPPLARMLRRWSNGFYLTSHELGLSYRDLQEGSQLAKDDAAALGRIADYGRYVMYLQCYFEHQQAQRGSPEKKAAAERLMRHMWSIYDSSMVHVFRLSQLLARDERTAGNLELATTFDWMNHAAPIWQAINPLGDDEVRAAVDVGVRVHPTQDFQVRKFAGELVRVPGAMIDEAAKPGELALINSLDFQVLAEKADYLFQPKIATEKAVQLMITDPDGNAVMVPPVETGANWQKEWSQPEIILKKPGVYRMQVVSQKRFFRFSPPARAIVSYPGWFNSQGSPTPRLYFFVPQGTARLAIYTAYISAGPPRFFDPAGTEVKPTLIDQGHLLLIDIPAEQQGKIWSLDQAKTPNEALVMLNAPGAFALSAGALLVPKEALTAD